VTKTVEYHTKMYILTYKIYDTDGKYFCNWSFTTKSKYDHARDTFPNLKMERVQ
jgi:repressor of nif and glnA expression